MSPVERVRRARTRLATASLAAAVLWAAAAGALVLLAGGIVAAIARPAGPARGAAPVVAAAAALATGALLLWRGRAVWSTRGVALWLEERAPQLRFALVTATDPTLPPAAPDSPLARAATEAANAAGIERLVGRASGRAVGRAALACAAAVAAAVLLPRTAVLPALAAGDALRSAAAADAPLPNRLLGIAARVTPPAYARLAPRELEDPANVPALVGSTVTLVGQGPADGVTMVSGDDTLAAAAEGSRWMVGLRMPEAPAAVRLRDRAYERIVTLEPLTDSAPTVTLRLPERDTTYRTPPRGRLVLEAAASDDIGLDHGYFDFLVSSGQDESFDTKPVEGTRVRLGNRRGATLHAVLDLDTLRLGPGNVLHIRAVAVDANDVTGPGRGFSETRTLRVASRQEYDSVAVRPADPLPIDTLYMSQRTLNMRTDTLVRDRRSIATAEFERLSRSYAVKQQEIRSRVDRVIAILEDDGVGGRSRTAQSELLREATGHMWEAYSMLAVDEPETAQPSMRKALALLDEARTAQRYHMRGVMRPNLVNIERVRMQGTDTAAAAAREARERLFDVRAILLGRLDAAARLAETRPQAAADSLLVLRLALLQAAPSAASPLERAAEELRGGGDATPHVLRARRQLAPPTRVSTGAAAWGGGGGGAP